MYKNSSRRPTKNSTTKGTEFVGIRTKNIAETSRKVNVIGYKKTMTRGCVFLKS